MLEGPMRAAKADQENPFQGANPLTLRFEEFHAQYRLSILHFIRGKISDPEMAEDVLQDTFLKAFKQMSRYDSKFSVYTWLRVIARSAIIDHLRRQRGTEASEFTEAACERADPEAGCLMAEIQTGNDRQISAALESLTQMQAKIMRMRLIEEKSAHEVAAELGMTLESVKSITYRAMKNIRPSLYR